jgi:hypothetical protein
MSRRAARILIDCRHLEEILQLPEGYSIFGAEWDFISNSLRLYVQGEALPEVVEGMQIPDLSANITIYQRDDGFNTKQYKWKIRHDWND